MKRLFILTASAVIITANWFCTQKTHPDLIDSEYLTALTGFAEMNSDTVLSEPLFTFNVKKVPKKGAVLFLRNSKEVNRFTTLDIQFESDPIMVSEKSINCISIILSSRIAYYKTPDGKIDKFNGDEIRKVNEKLEELMEDLPEIPKIRTTRI